MKEQSEMKLISWQDIWTTIGELERIGSSRAQEVFLKAILELVAFDDTRARINDGSREGRS